jgi:DNA polymerase-3 subunit alpha
MTFTHLHTHSHFSLLEAVPQIGDLVEKAKSLGYQSLALTDNNNLYGAIEFQKECKYAGIKSIIGVEISVVEKSMWEEINTSTNRIFKLVLLCKDQVGYKNLIKLVSHAHILPKGKFAPCVDLEELEKHSEGLICLSGLTESYLTEKLRNEDVGQAGNYLLRLKEIFGINNFYIELGIGDTEEGKKVRELSVQLSKKLNIPLVASSNSHYLNLGDRAAQKVLMGISNEIDGKEKFNRVYKNGNFSFHTPQEVEKYFSDIPEAIENTEKIADDCNLEITLGNWVFPKIEIPDNKNPDDYLREITFAGFERRKMEQNGVTLKRVNYELDVIKMKGYANYFLCVADLLRAAKEKNILTNIRGSVSGSLVTYLSGITNIDPLEFEIPFERFLNPDRPSAPDIDMDYADNRREEMVEYVKEKYGVDKIAQIGTFGTMAARAAVRDVARSMGYPYMVGDRISKLIPMGSQGFPMTLERALTDEPDFKRDYDENRETKEIVDMAKRIEGNVRHIGVHAAGVLISPSDLNDFTPIQFDPKGEGKIISQYDMYSVEDAGLLKFDFLGLGNLAIIADAIEMIYKNYGVQLDYDTIDMKDKKTFEMLTRGETTDTFQLNGTGMTKFLMELAPTSVNDINAMVALYRPGPLQFIPEYIKRKNNPEIITYLDEALRPILEKTYGILVYQDDLLMMAHKLAGYSWGEVDKFRKAVGKKIPEEMAKQKEQFINGCVSHSSWEKKKATELWTWIEPFAAYGFNKAHSVSYGRVAYVTAYLKANYPTEYMTAVLHSEEGEVDKVAISVKECSRLGIIISPPNVNYSENHFTIIKGKDNSPDTIVFGLNTIKNLGSNAVEEIVKQRNQDGKFKNLSDFIKRVDKKTTNKKSLEALINSGAFDDFTKNDGDRSKMFLNIEDILSYQMQIHDTHAGEMSLFGEMEDVSDLKLKKVEPLTRKEILKNERELLGLYLSGHPLDPWREILKQRQINISKINKEIKDGASVDFAGIVTSVKMMLTKKKDKMAFIQVADLDDEIEVVVFPKAYELFKDKIVRDTPMLFRGKVSLKNKDENKSENADAHEKKVRDDGTEAKNYGNKAIILDEIKTI